MVRQHSGDRAQTDARDKPYCRPWAHKTLNPEHTPAGRPLLVTQSPPPPPEQCSAPPLLCLLPASLSLTGLEYSLMSRWLHWGQPRV